MTILGNVADSCGHPFGFRPLIFWEFIFMLNHGASIFSSLSFSASVCFIDGGRAQFIEKLHPSVKILSIESPVETEGIRHIKHLQPFYFESEVN